MGGLFIHLIGGLAVAVIIAKPWRRPWRGPAPRRYWVGLAAAEVCIAVACGLDLIGNGIESSLDAGPIYVASGLMLMLGIIIDALFVTPVVRRG